MTDVIYQGSGKSNRTGVTLSGSHKVGRVAVMQMLRNPARQDGVFDAVIRDPETGKVLRRVPLWSGQAGEQVDMIIEFVTTKVHPK